MATTFQLKKFNINLSDINFLKDQINFKPLFDAKGNAIIQWDGTGAIYDAQKNLLWNGVLVTSTRTPGIHNATEALATYGSSYDSLTAAQGLRDVTGANNNLSQVNKFWGAVEQPFMQTVAPDFSHYAKAMAAGSTDASYANNTFGESITGSTDYTKTKAFIFDQKHTGDVVDYTPRMISRTITTGNAIPLEDTAAANPVDGGQVLHWNAARFSSDPAYAAVITGAGINPATAGLIEGAAIMKDPGSILLAGGQHDPQDTSNHELFFGQVNPGVAPGNSWLAYFGQFFDHGLDFIGKGGGLAPSKITIPLALDDPLYRAPNTNFQGDPGNTHITVSRADVSAYDANGNPQWVNHSSPYIDQSQTYGSNAQTTELLREWVSTDGGKTYHAGAHLLDGKTSVAWTNAFGQQTTATLPTLNELRAHLLATGRDDLTWDDVLNLRNRDANGDVVTGTAAGKSGQALLLDMNPHFDTQHFTQATIAALTAAGIKADASGNYAMGGPGSLGTLIDFATFNPIASSGALNSLAQTVLIESVGDHYIAGDGRVNENVGLTAIHHVFHEEHNYQVQNIENAILAQDARAVTLGDSSHSIAHDWQTVTATKDAKGNYTLGSGGPIAWDDSKVFNAAKLVVEMEYQHTAVDQYARTITPDLPEFVGYNSNVNATVSLEFAQGAFRFGHSTMRETIDYMDPNGSITGKVMNVALEQAFLNPALFAQKGAASIAMGMMHQQMNEVDELLTPAMNEGLLGQPLDLAAINIARGRDLGLPTLNDFREAVGLTRYLSWSDYGNHMIHPESLVNFIAAYSFDGNMAKAQAMMSNGAFMYGDLTIAGADGFNHIDTWLGGLAEAHVAGGMLGETFNLVFLDQIERLMDGDRFYYLYRLNNLNLGDEIGNAQFKDLIERNTGLTHLNGSAFAYADQYIDLSEKVDPTHTTGSFQTDHKYGQLLEDRAAAKATTLGVYSTKETTTKNMDTSVTSFTHTAGNGSIVTIQGKEYILDIRAEGSYGNANVNGQNLDGTPDTGADSNEVMVGTANNDRLDMFAGDDTAYGDGGDDIIDGGAGNDRLYGGAGSDTIHGGDGADLIDGGDGDDKLYGDSSASSINGTDQIIGSDGNDIIYGGIGIDKLSGGRGDDLIFGEADTDPFTHGGDGNDYIDGGTSGDVLWGDGGDDLIVGAADQDIVAGLDGDDILRPGAPSSAMGIGPDEVMGGDGTSDLGNDGKGVGFDLIDLSDYAAGRGVNADFSTQANPLTTIPGTILGDFPQWVGIEGLIGTRNNDTVLGDDSGNWLIGGSGSDILTGLGGNDIIVGNGIRLDSLIGTYANAYTSVVDGATHRTTGFVQTNGLIDAAGPAFQKHFTEMLKSAMFKDLELGGSTIKALQVDGVDVADTRIGDGGVAGTDTVVYVGNRSDYSVATINFTAPNGEKLTAFKITDNGHASADPLLVRAASEGTDLVVGVQSFQFADKTLSALQMTNFAPTGSVGFTGADGSITVNRTSTPVAQLSPTSGIFDINVITPTNPTGAVTIPSGSYNWQTSTNGTTWTNIATGNGLNQQSNLDVLSMTATTGTGRLIHAVATYSDEFGPASVTSPTWNLIVGNASVNSPLNGTTSLTVGDIIFGLDGNDVINGLAGDDFLYGGAGNDTLNGGDGNDLLNGGTGNDTLVGGLGDDTYVVDSASDVVTEGTSAGLDTIQSSITYTLGANLENLTLTGSAAINGTGNALSNVLTGNSGANVLTGSAGDDTYVVGAGDTVVELANEGTDEVQSALTYSLSALANIENLTLTGTGNINGTGNAQANVITGNSGNNTLDGAAGIDTLIGGIGNDTLIGGAGADKMTGGLGDDTYSVDDVGDTVIEDVTAGTDLVQSTVTYTLGANLENLTLTGSAAINGTGNALSNVLTGNSGANVLTGGAGDDTYVVGAGDTVVELANEGTDEVQSALTYTLAANVENLTLTGSAAINGTGNALDNVLTGNGGNNTLTGGAGNDTLIGGAGTDTAVFSGNAATFQFGPNSVTVSNTAQGIDTLSQIESVTFTDGTFTLLVGTAAGTTLTGSNGSDLIFGLDGNDTLTGGTGRDILVGGAGNDTFDFNAVGDSGLTAGARDLIVDFLTGDHIDLSTIDANSATNGNQAFTFIGEVAFTAAGQLRYVYDATTGIGLLEANTTGTAGAEFQIELQGKTTLAATDFVL